MQMVVTEPMPAGGAYCQNSTYSGFAQLWSDGFDEMIDDFCMIIDCFDILLNRTQHD
jgi:hypothetical protein